MSEKRMKSAQLPDKTTDREDTHLRVLRRSGGPLSSTRLAG
jgi:hypothetical protein